ncbi:MAG: hypothetical protein LBQ79_14130 [Deltaproteobacteria bacterium]|nr:hypothetical protein [Deltaproteobacteria bacterium]
MRGKKKKKKKKKKNTRMRMRMRMMMMMMRGRMRMRMMMMMRGRRGSRRMSFAGSAFLTGKAMSASACTYTRSCQSHETA